MGNEHLTLKMVVPSKIRREVYLKALDYYREGDYERFRKCEKGKPKPTTYLNLGMLLPCLLWGLDCWTDESPSGEWDWDDTDKAFPEIRKISLKISKVKDHDLKQKIRFSELKRIISTLN